MSGEALSKALAVLGGENATNNISLSSKIELLENKGLSSSEVLEALKLASTSGALKLAGSARMRHDWIWTTAVPWVSVLAVGLLTSYFTGDCGDEEDVNNNNNLNDPLLTQPSPDMLPIDQESGSLDEMLARPNGKIDRLTEEPIWATKVSIYLHT